jgi:hypothetical protein
MNDFYLRVMRCMEDNNESLWWRTDEEYAPITFFINCNDAFWWGSADAERITEANIGILEQAIKDHCFSAQELEECDHKAQCTST